MAYYVADLERPNTEYTARGSGSEYHSLSTFMDSVYRWLEENGIPYTWTGERVYTRGNIVTYYVTVRIHDKYQAVLFGLRWA